MKIPHMVAYTLAAAGLITGIRMMRGTPEQGAPAAAESAPDGAPATIPFAPAAVVTDVRGPSQPKSNIREEKRVRAEARTDALRTTLAPLQGEAVYVQGIDDPAPPPARPKIPGPDDLRR